MARASTSIGGAAVSTSAVIRVARSGIESYPQLSAEPVEASLRELREETGLRPEHVELVAEHPAWLAYELPPGRRRDKLARGQVQKWFLYRFLGSDDDIDFTPPKGERQEFKAFRWMDLGELAEVMWEIKRPIYLALVDEWAERLKDWAEPD